MITVTCFYISTVFKLLEKNGLSLVQRMNIHFFRNIKRLIFEKKVQCVFLNLEIKLKQQTTFAL